MISTKDSNQQLGLAATEQFYDDVSSTFWTIFFFYIVASVGWVMYCCISHRMELELVENKIVENGIARSAEIQRLLHAYNRVNIDLRPDGRIPIDEETV